MPPGTGSLGSAERKGVGQTFGVGTSPKGGEQRLIRKAVPPQPATRPRFHSPTDDVGLGSAG